MYLTHEMYVHMKWHPSLAKAGYDDSLKCYDIPTKYVVQSNSTSIIVNHTRLGLWWTARLLDNRMKCHKRLSLLQYQQNLLLQGFDRHRKKDRKVQRKQTKSVDISADTELGKGKPEKNSWSVCLFPLSDVRNVCKVHWSAIVNSIVIILPFLCFPLLFTFFNICQQ